MAHLMEEYPCNGRPWDIRPVVGPRDGDEMSPALFGPKLLVGGQPPYPGRPSNHRQQLSLEMGVIQLLEQFLEIQSLAAGVLLRHPVCHMRTHPGEDAALTVLPTLAGTRERAQRGSDPVLKVRLDLRRCVAQNLRSLADPMPILLDQAPTSCPATRILYGHFLAIQARSRFNSWQIPMHRLLGLAFEQVQDELESGPDHERAGRGNSKSSIRLRTGPKERR
jgi:hypothetical protein